MMIDDVVLNSTYSFQKFFGAVNNFLWRMCGGMVGKFIKAFISKMFGKSLDLHRFTCCKQSLGMLQVFRHDACTPV